MPLYASNASSSSARVEALKAKHYKLSKKIETEQRHTAANDYEIAQLKREKLMLKEKIEGIR